MCIFCILAFEFKVHLKSMLVCIMKPPPQPILCLPLSYVIIIFSSLLQMRMMMIRMSTWPKGPAGVYATRPSATSYILLLH